MKMSKFLSGLFLLGGLCFLAFSGCRSGSVIKMPDSVPDNFAAYKQISVYANSPWAKSTGIEIKKDDIFSIIVSGKVNTNPKRYPKLWESANYRLVMFAGGKRTFGPMNMTLNSMWEGEIKFLVLDGPHHKKSGNAKNPDWYKSNRGRFEVTVIVWKIRIGT